MFLSPLSRSNLPILPTLAATIDRVSSFKLLGFYTESTFCWSLPVNNMVKTSTQTLYFIKQLKRAGLPSNHLFHYYSTVIRPVLEYCIPVRHYALTKGQAKQIEVITKTHWHYLNFVGGMSYMLTAASLITLADSKSQESSFSTFLNLLLACQSRSQLLISGPTT